MNKIEIAKGKKPNDTPKLGDMYIDLDKNIYILAQVSHNEFCCVGLENGNRWRSSMRTMEQAIDSLKFYARDVHIKLTI